ncbi:hypothetical protein V3C99_013390 [Haemonchus contortus]
MDRTRMRDPVAYASTSWRDGPDMRFSGDRWRTKTVFYWYPPDV